jgi:acyl-CoA thioester hydrolase
MDDSSIFNQSVYKHWVDDHVRFGDLDPLGHVNNNAIGQYFENARAFLFMLVTPGWPRSEDLFILARTAIDFRRELHLPAALRVGSRILKIGRTSMVLGNALFAEKAGAEIGIAACESVSVLIDLKTREPKPFPDHLRATLEQYM